MFKRVALPMVALAAFTAVGAQAADLGGAALRGSEVIAAAPSYVDKWSGFYIGGQVGLQSQRNWGSHSDATGAQRPDGNGVMHYDFDYDYANTRFSYGLHAGYQRLFNQVLFGIEADFEGPMGAIQSSWYNSNPDFGVGNHYQQRLQSNWQGSVRARLGWTHHKTLFYMTGGLAFANFKACTVLDDCQGFVGHVVKYNSTRFGWTIGAGIEHKFSYNWSARLEYRYTNYGSKSCLATAACSINPNSSDINNRIETHAIRVGVSYLFGAPPMAVEPIIARY
ncbi:outer membrane protein [Phreatobacter stygius]|uniref:Porin family protein n=1 Tax=Phreatobacter stygius TaxID=1940610 RepID=A0A4D7BBH5_9HYPH|nr:outer membrane protein [Phreatobacter stygius]QCI68050.1 porin family protein [Phreatobacter stygius]